MKKILSTAIFVSALCAGSAFAQTCDSPLQLTVGTHSGDTTTAANTIAGFGPLPSPHNDIVYSFVAEGADSTITVTESNYDYAVVVISACDGVSPAPLFASTGPAAGGEFQLGGLTDGATYYVVITGNPSVDQPQNGTFTLTATETLPVELQNFSVD